MIKHSYKLYITTLREYVYKMRNFWSKKFMKFLFNLFTIQYILKFEIMQPNALRELFSRCPASQS